MEMRNVTLSIPVDLMREAKIVAARRDSSMSRLLTEALEKLVREDRAYEIARERNLRLLRRGLDLGTNGRINGKRSDLHER